MAESLDPFMQERRGLFDGLRVPFDVNMLILGALAVAVFVGCIWGIEQVDNEPHLLPRISVKLMGGDYQAYETSSCSRTIHGMLGTYQPWGKVLNDYMKAKGIQDVTVAQKKILEIPRTQSLMILFVLIVVWAFFGSAINRIAAMRIAREETFEIKEALFFARDKFTSNFFSIVFLLFMFVFFYLFWNATVAGGLNTVVGWIPGIGGYLADVLLGVFFFLCLLSMFFLVAALVLGLFGFNLVSSAIATESSDIVDGISRAWNYVLFRPWQMLLGLTLTFAYIGIFLFFSNIFLSWSIGSLGVGDWGIGNKERFVAADDGGIYAAPSKEMFLKYYALPGLANQSRSVPYTWSYKKSPDSLMYEAEQSQAWYQDNGYGTKMPVNLDKPVDLRSIKLANGEEAVPQSWFAAGILIWAWLLAMRYLILGYVISYFFGANTLIYFLLRKDVEGEDYSEIILEEEMWEEDEFAEWDESFPPLGEGQKA